MTITIPYANSAVEINTTTDGSLMFTFSNSNDIAKIVFDRLLYNMSYDDIINVITPQSFEQIMEHYNTEYEKE